MQARISLFKLKEGDGEVARRIADQLAPALRSLEGIERVDFLADDEKREYGAYTVWRTREDMEKADPAIAAKTREIAGDALEPDSARIFDIYVPSQ